MAVTTDEIKSFIQRLMRRELEAGELADLTTRDLGDINAYLAEHAQADLAKRGNTSDVLEPNMLEPDRCKPGKVPKPRLTGTATRTYSEEEILAEFGVLD